MVPLKSDRCMPCNEPSRSYGSWRKIIRSSSRRLDRVATSQPDLGLIRDMVLERLFGATPRRRCFFVAFAFPPLRELLRGSRSRPNSGLADTARPHTHEPGNGSGSHHTIDRRHHLDDDGMAAAPGRQIMAPGSRRLKARIRRAARVRFTIVFISLEERPWACSTRRASPRRVLAVFFNLSYRMAGSLPLLPER